MQTNEQMAERIAQVLDKHYLSTDQQLDLERVKCLVLACLQRNANELEELEVYEKTMPFMR